jgi:HlyD family secretion protein
MHKRAKIGIGVALLVAIGAGAGVTISSGKKKGAEVRVEKVAAKDLVASVTASGWIRPHKKVDVQADIMGRITSLNVKEGDHVQKGQVLLRIDPTQYEAQVTRARAAVSDAMAREGQARASMIQADRAFQRAQLLASRDSMLISRQNVEEAETQARVQRELASSAHYNVEMARASLNETINQLGKTVLRAPMDGIVTRLKVEEGETAIVGTMNNTGSLLLTVSDLSSMEAVVRVDETDLPNMQLGDSATIEIDAFPRQRFVGHVSEISHSAVHPQQDVAQSSGSQGQAVDFEVVVRLDHPPNTLRPDLSATAEVVTATRKHVLVIPIIALTVRDRGASKAVPNEDPSTKMAAADAIMADKMKQDQEGVFLVRKGKAKFVPVTVGIAGKEYFEVTRGLVAGDSVVAGPYEVIRTLEDGKPVRLLKNDAKGAKGAVKVEVK